MEKEKPDDIEIAIMYVLDYCKEHGVYAYNDYMERSFNDSLMRVIKFHKEQHVFKK